MKLSIIVPVYKVEEYLDTCVKLILAQSYGDYELILVDDGSPDGCGLLCDTLAKADSRIRVIHKANGGLSDARNAGIEVAQGEYIGFVDSDDYIKPDMYEILIHNLEKYDADISMCGYIDVYANGIRHENADRSVQLWNREETIYQILLGKVVSVHAWVKLYRRSLFDGIRYPKGRISEDAYIIMDLLDRVSKTVFTPYTAYYYVHREDSINTSKYKPIDRTRIEAHEKNLRYIEQEFPHFRKLAWERYLGAVAYVASKMALSGIGEKDNDCKALFSVLRNNLWSIMNSEYFSINRKLSVVLMLLNKSAYARFYEYHFRLK